MRKKYHIWISILGCGILGALLFGNQLEQIHPEAGSVLVVIIFAAFIYLNLTQQCPKCGKSLTNRVWRLRKKKIVVGKRITMPRQCPACGKQI